MEKELLDINLKMAEAERTQQKQILIEMHNILSEDLVFRRASGTVVGKNAFFDQLQHIKYERLEAKVLNILPISDHITMVEVEVQAKGTNDQKPFQGIFHNTRFFCRDGNSWKLYAWHNYNMKDLPPRERSFTGLVWPQEIESSIGEKKQAKCRNVIFDTGARTFWHLHTGQQELSVLFGKAEVVIGKNGKPKIYQTGDQIVIPPGELHWHGAVGSTIMVHLAINRPDFLGRESTSYWFEEPA